MSFVHLPFLLVMGIPLVLFGYLILTDRDPFLEIFEPKVLERLSQDHDALPPKGRKFLLLMALFWMIVAMARPVIDHGEKRITLEGLHALVALDISASMRANDCYPTRLECAKQKILSLFEQMPYDELGVIAFAKVPFMVAPFSSDKAILGSMVEGISTEYINMSSTNFKAMGDLASTLLKDKKEKILILFSDGDDTESLHDFGLILEQEKIHLYAVLIGSDRGTPVLNKKGKPLIYQGKIPITKRNDALGVMAKSTGGDYVIATTGDDEIVRLTQQIKADHHTQKQGELVIHNRQELFYYPLGLGVFLLLLAFSSLPTSEELRWRWRRGKGSLAT